MDEQYMDEALALAREAFAEVCDYIAGMTDNYAVDKYTELFIPMGWQVRG